MAALRSILPPEREGCRAAPLRVAALPLGEDSKMSLEEELLVRVPPPPKPAPPPPPPEGEAMYTSDASMDVLLAEGDETWPDDFPEKEGGLGFGLPAPADDGLSGERT